MKRILLILIAFLCFNAAQAQQLIPGAADGFLTAWYPFCGGSTSDASGDGYLLLNKGGVTADTSYNKVLNAAMNFIPLVSFTPPTTPNYLYFNASFPMTTDYSYACWIYPRDSQQSIIWYNGTPGTNGIGLVMCGADSVNSKGANIGIDFGGIIPSNAPPYISTPITLNRWHHVVVTKSVGVYRLYVDTTLSGFIVPATAPILPAGTGGNFTIGNDVSTERNQYDGKIDDFGVFSRQLSQPEVKQLYHFPTDIIFKLPADTVLPITIPTLAIKVDSPIGAYLDSSYHYAWTKAATADTNRFGTLDTLSLTPTNVSLQISKLYACASTDMQKVSNRKVTVIISNSKLIPGKDTLKLCAGIDSVTLSAPITRTDSTTVKRIWNTGDTSTVIHADADGLYWVTVDSVGVSRDSMLHFIGSDSIYVVLYPAVKVDLGDEITHCQGETALLQSSYTYTASPTYLWNDLITTTPTFTATVSGTYWLQVTDGACTAADTIKVHILYDTFTLHTTDQSICAGTTISALATSGNPDVHFQWTPTVGVAASSSASPTINPDVSRYYYVTAIDSACQRVDSFYVDKQPNPVVDLGDSRSVCQHDTLHLNPVITPADYTHYTFSWTPTANLNDPTKQNPIFTAGDSTHLFLTVTTPLGCTGSDSVYIYMYHSNLLLPFHDTAICPGDSVHLFPQMTDDAIQENLLLTYRWHPVMYVYDTTSPTPWIHPATSQNYYTIATSQFGCNDTEWVRITVNPNAVIYLGDSVSLVQGTSYQISPETNCSYFSWTPALGLNDTSFSNPIATPLASTQYYVFARTEQGCSVYDSLRFHIDPTNFIHIPNAFTPGSSINNTLFVIKQGLKQLHYFRVYDRWGTKVYETTNLDAGWDGMFNGKEQPFGVYVYDIEAVANNNRIYQRQGNVTLIR